MIRVETGMSTSRFCALLDMPERTWRRWQSKAKADRPPKDPWPRPARKAARSLVTAHALAKPEWGHRKIWARTRHDGHRVSQATVLWLLRDDGLILPSEYQYDAIAAVELALADYERLFGPRSSTTLSSIRARRG